jgi:hypothetical protein
VLCIIEVCIEQFAERDLVNNLYKSIIKSFQPNSTCRFVLEVQAGTNRKNSGTSYSVIQNLK